MLLQPRRSATDLRCLTDATHLEDPAPLYERLLAAGVSQSRDGDLIAARHEDVVTVLRNPSFGRDPMPSLPSRTMRIMFGLFLLLDPPDHTRLRQVVSPLLSADAHARLTRHVERVAQQLLDDADPRSFDVVRDFARPLALDAICSELGVEEVDPRLSRATQVVTEGLDAPFVTRFSKPIPVLRLIAAGTLHPLRALREGRHLVRLADRTIARPTRQDDPPTLRAIRSAAADGTISGEEASAIWLQLLLAGVDTSTTLISNAVHLLCTNPDQLDRLRDDPSLVDGAVEETLRFESPLRIMGRVAHADVVVGGRTVRRGDTAVVLFGAANRDPAVFDDPNRFDITRPTRPAHVAFGQGIHFCLGAALARLEARAALAALVPRIPREPQPIDVRWRKLHLVRGLDTFRLPIEHLAGSR